jgi:PAS domain S-box-containing protein
MSDAKKTKAQLLDEVESLRRRVSALEAEGAKYKMLEKTLRESEEKFRIVFESIEDAITVTDLSGKVLDVNRAALRIFGFEDKEEVIGQEGFRFIAEKSREKAMDDMMKLFEEENRGPVEYTFQTADGREFEVESSNALLRDDYGKLIGFVSINRDITDRKVMEEALRVSVERYRSVVESANDAIISIDSTGNIIFWNPAAEAIFGHSASEMIGRQLELVVPERLRAGLRQALTHLLSTHNSAAIQKTTELVGLRKDGSEVPVEHSIATWQAEGETFYTAIIRDITERKWVEENIQIYIDEITRTQEKERERIARELHDETIQNLATLLLDIEALSTHITQLPDDDLKHLEQIRERIEATMEGVRRFSFELRPGVLDQLGLLPAIGSLVEGMSGRVDTRVEIIGTERRLPPEVELALFRIAQEALVNLRKHSSAEKAVVQIEFTRNKVRLDVTDNGRGFTLPERLSDLDSKSNLGILGMRERAYLVGGSFSIHTEVGSGTTVTVEVEE